MVLSEDQEGSDDIGTLSTCEHFYDFVLRGSISSFNRLHGPAGVAQRLSIDL